MNTLVTTIGLAREGKTRELLEYANNICEKNEDNTLKLTFITTEESVDFIYTNLKYVDRIKVIFADSKYDLINRLKENCNDNSSVVFIDNINLLSLSLEELYKLMSEYQFDCYCTTKRI